MDVRSMTDFQAAYFDAVIDKGATINIYWY